LFECDKQVVFRFILGISKLDPDAAQDVLQNTFVRAFRSLDSLREDGAYETWLLTIARREVLRFVSRRKLGTDPIESELEIACEQEERIRESAERERLIDAIRSAAAAVEPESVRETAIRYYLGDPCTTERLAAELGVPHGTVRKRLFLFRKKLRERLQEER
jgi:RNA polymerase sigma-70 factor (ECF subfamily)